MRKFFSDIKREVCEKHGVTKEEFDGVCRTDKIVNCRHEAWWRAKQETDLSFSQIGKGSGGKHHTTVLHGVQRHEARLRRANPDYATLESHEGSSVR